MKIVLRILGWATDQVEGSDAGPIELKIASGSRWPRHEAALVWLGPEVAIGATIQMGLAQGALHQQAISWASDNSIRQLLMASRSADSALTDLFDSIEVLDPIDLAKGSCIGCSEGR